ncbi:hypothetical protein H6P81_003041 [Aristolochia fimbriata]|uniref:Transmembrane protein n=1 Tax=Aristolochia fimbriata TaxID=158543 RepID=A0AAV7FC75_ARIFI|nr:hypothetical protein H6P81_003041 [Aristolochia fimbriata]
MMQCCSSTRAQIRFWLRDYDTVQAVAVFLIYIQIGSALIGSLGALFNGVLLVNLVVSLFALIAIESSSQSLGRTYAVLLVCEIFLDVMWFILFSHEIWNISFKQHGPHFIFSVRLTFWMQVVGFTARLLSSLLWIQMYRLGASCIDSTPYRDADFDLRNSFLNPTYPPPSNVIDRQTSQADDILGGSIYDPAYYSSLFQDDNGYAYRVDHPNCADSSGCPSSPERLQLISCSSKSTQDDNALQNLLQNT